MGKELFKTEAYAVNELRFIHEDMDKFVAAFKKTYGSDFKQSLVVRIYSDDLAKIKRESKRSKRTPKIEVDEKEKPAPTPRKAKVGALSIDERDVGAPALSLKKRHRKVGTL